MSQLAAPETGAQQAAATNAKKQKPSADNDTDPNGPPEVEVVVDNTGRQLLKFTFDPGKYE